MCPFDVKAHHQSSPPCYTNQLQAPAPVVSDNTDNELLADRSPLSRAIFCGRCKQCQIRFVCSGLTLRLLPCAPQHRALPDDDH